MSIRARLKPLFLALTVLAVSALAIVVVLALDDDANDGKADARLASGLEAGISLYEEQLAKARAAGERIARELTATDLFQTPQGPELAAEARRLVRERPIAAVAIIVPGEPHAAVGFPDVVAVAEVTVREGGEERATVEVATLSALAYVREVSRVAGHDAAVIEGTRVLASTVPLGDTADLPAAGGSADVVLRGRVLHAAAAELPGESEQELVVFAAAPAGR